VAARARTQTPALAAQPTDDEGAKNAKKARAVLDAMVQALGGDAWLNMKNVERQGQVAAFFHGGRMRGRLSIRISPVARPRPH